MVCFNQVVNYPIRQRLFSISDQTNLIKKDKMPTSRFPIGKSLDYEIMKSEVWKWWFHFCWKVVSQQHFNNGTVVHIIKINICFFRSGGTKLKDWSTCSNCFHMFRKLQIIWCAGLLATRQIYESIKNTSFREWYLKPRKAGFLIKVYMHIGKYSSLELFFFLLRLVFNCKDILFFCSNRYPLSVDI